MEKHIAIVAGNILKKIDEIEDVLKYIESIEEEDLEIKTRDCPYCIPIKTINLRKKIYELIKTAYEEELNDFKSRLKNL